MSGHQPYLQPLFEKLERRMYLDIYRAMPVEVGQGCGVSVIEDGAALRLGCERVNHPFFNRVMGLPSDGRNLGDWLDEVAGAYDEQGVSRWMLQILPGELTAEVIETLESRALVALRGWAKHAGATRLVEAPPAAERCDLRIERIGPDWAGEWAGVLGPAFGYPKEAFSWPAATVGRLSWTHYAAFDDDELVATAALYIAGGVGSLNFASTKDSHRRRGAQSALIARRIRDARRIGLDWLVTETDEELPERPNPSYHNIVRAGMAVQYVRANWGPPPPAT